MGPIKKHSLFFAPMEGVTDPLYREVIDSLYPHWDYYCCDFLRIPSHGNYPQKKIRSHYGERILENPRLKAKTYYQVLASERCLLAPTLQGIQALGVNWVDLNLGCPAKTVNGHGGGSYLLQDLKSLEKILKRFRELIHGRFSAKIRVGYHDDANFEDILILLEDCGVELITIHGRTRDQQYKGRANWGYIKRAVELCSIPIIGNGDIWTLSDIEQIFDETDCHSVMLARGAMKSPWISELYYDYQDRLYAISQDQAFLEEVHHFESERYFNALIEAMEVAQVSPERQLKRLKSLVRFWDVPREFLRSKTKEEGQHYLFHQSI
jgi:tRNA-dihydrouridine synthase B